MRNILTAIWMTVFLGVGNVAAVTHKADSLATLAGIKGSDMSLYDLYADNLPLNRDAAMEYALMFVERVDSTAVDPVIARMYDQIAEWYEMDKFLFSKAIAWRERSMAAYGSLGDRYRKVKSEFHLAKLHLKRFEYHKTLKYANSAVQEFRKMGAGIDEMECNKLLGVVYEVCQDYDRSAQYFREYTRAARELNDSMRIFIGLNNTAAFASSAGDNEKTTKILDESIELAKRSGDTGWLSKLYLNAAASHIEAGEWDKAEEDQALAWPLCRNIERQGHYWLNWGVLYESRGRAGDGTDAIASYEKAADCYKQGEFDTILQEIYASLNQLYIARGDTQTAYDYLEAMYDIERASGKQDILIEMFRTQNEIERMRDAEKLEAERNRRIVLWLSVALVVAVIVGGVWIVLARRARRNKRNETPDLNRMQQFRTDKIIEEAVGKLNETAADTQNEGIKEDLRQVISILRNVRDDRHWKELEQYIPDFDSEFYRSLIRKFPDLTANECRLCVLLNRNLSTKQISEITRQSPDSINVARTRLRRKLGISGTDISIQEFLKKYIA